MLFTPKYTVSYKGVFHKAGAAFQIDQKDRTEMERHGKVVEDKPVQPTTLTEKAETPATEDKPAKKGGRPRKVSA